jgi:hypothetical protein
MPQLSHHVAIFEPAGPTGLGSRRAGQLEGNHQRRAGDVLGWVIHLFQVQRHSLSKVSERLIDRVTLADLRPSKPQGVVSGRVLARPARRPKSRRTDGSGHADVYLHGPCTGT